MIKCCVRTGVCQRQLRAQGAPPHAAAPHRQLSQVALAALHPLHLQEPVQVRGPVAGFACNSSAHRDPAHASCWSGTSMWIAGTLHCLPAQRASSASNFAGCMAAPSWTRCWRAATSGCSSCWRSWGPPSEYLLACMCEKPHPLRGTAQLAGALVVPGPVQIVKKQCVQTLCLTAGKAGLTAVTQPGSAAAPGAWQLEVSKQAAAQAKAGCNVVLWSVSTSRVI